LVVLKCKKIQKCTVAYHVKTLISSQKFRDISRNFVIFRDTKFSEITRNTKNYFAKYEINISRNFATEKFRRPPFSKYAGFHYTTIVQFCNMFLRNLEHMLRIFAQV
jgi:hypothetical protein